MRARRMMLIAVLAGLLGGACDRGDDTGLNEDAFVATVVGLRIAAAQGDSAAFERARDSILEAHDVSEVELRAWAEAAGEQPDRSAGLWQRVQDSLQARTDSIIRADSLARADSVARADSLAGADSIDADDRTDPRASDTPGDRPAGPAPSAP